MKFRNLAVIAKWKRGEGNVFVPYPYGANPHGVTGKVHRIVKRNRGSKSCTFSLRFFRRTSSGDTTFTRTMPRFSPWKMAIVPLYMVFNGSASSRKISRVRWENDEEVTGSQILQLVRDRFLLEVGKFFEYRFVSIADLSIRIEIDG